ncbi:MAG: HD domain-containing protein [Chloroflexi bacterium]|nr:HD domain-containing protein [Chloroflexota bacterium]
MREIRRRVWEAHAGDASGHDWWHVVRVANLALHLARAEGADERIVLLAAYLHDVGSGIDRREHGTVGADLAEHWLAELGVDEPTIGAVTAIIRTLSFKSPDQAPPDVLEGRVVQDADRLDAIGAIGIARTFAFGGAHGQAMHNPDVGFESLLTAEEYVERGCETTIAHFYQKLLRLRDLMTTATGRALAEERHAFMAEFLQRFHAEWSFGVQRPTPE